MITKKSFLLFIFVFLAGCSSSGSIGGLSGQVDQPDLTEKTTGLDDSTVQQVLSEEARVEELDTEESDDVRVANDRLAESISDVSDKPGIYDTFDQQKLDDYLKNGKKVLLFFHASWNPTCKALEKDILSKKSSIPSEVVILKVDYDTAVELGKKYGVTIQNTIIALDNNGKEIGRKSIGITQLKELEPLMK
ncbi:MAG TPA: thioredoxin family protein [Candidatus Absconditabacterales bacterium]|nr:thioredoxin family protein [Candidatus Absconditabacterales bacterium]